MKKLFALLLALVMVLSLAACGGGDDEKTPSSDDKTPSSTQQQEQNTPDPDEGEDEPDNNGDEQMQGDDSGAGGLLENVTRDNGEEIAKELFGIDMNPGDGWECTSASSYNKVNNFSITYDGSNDADGTALMQFYFDAMAAVSTEGVCGQVTDWSTNKVSKTDPYADFETYVAEDTNATLNNGYASALWIYDYNGKSIQFSFQLQGATLNLMLTLMS